MIEIAYSACDLPWPLTRQLDALCDQFEQSLRAGQLPELHVLVEQVDPIAQSKLLTELVGMEWEYWLQQGFEDPTEKMVGRHPNLAKRIESILAHRASATRAAGASTDALQANQATLTTNGLLVRCPHCHAAFQLLVDAPLTDITCHSCENRFSLTGSALDPQQAKIITQIGRFELIDRLGIGAFGTVWKARDVELDRIVAIKIPRRAQSEEENERFLREARAAAQLQHPNIVPVLEVGRDQDRIYIVSEFIAGKSLAAILKSQRLDHREAVRLMAQIADALDYAHQKGVIHRDMKPSNVILDMAGQPHVADFGLAKREMGESTLTLEGQVLGTPAYMSPEQARGEARRTALQSDIYSLGVMLFELLTGGLPFRGSTPLLLHLAIHEQAPSPRRVDPTVPRDLETITLKCLEKEPALRYQSAHRLADDLTHFLRSEPIIARPLAPLCLAISSDDKQLASGHSDGIVRLWQLDEAKLLAELVGHSKSVSSVHFSHDGRTLVSTSADATSRVWSVGQQRCLGVLHQALLEISPSGRQMVFGYPDQAVNDRLFPTTFIQSID